LLATRRKWKQSIWIALWNFLLVTAYACPLGASGAPIREDFPSLSKKLNLPIYMWSDSKVPCQGVILAIHGLTFYASAFDEFAKYLASSGYIVYAPDMRGFGRWKTDYAKFNGDSKVHFSQTKEDLLRVADDLRRSNPEAKLFVLGESLGANFAIWLASSKPNLVDGVICSGPCYKRWLHPRARWAKDFATSFWRPHRELNLEPYINPYLSSDRSLTVSCLKDPLIMRRMSPVDLFKTNITNAETLCYVSNLPAEMPMFIIAGDKDAVFKPQSIPKLVSMMGCADSTRLELLRGKGHLLIEHQSVDPVIAKMVEDWLKERNQNQKLASDSSKTAP
jgi:alpha-beta hydrolase superfamily lysophospholipase